MHLFTIQLEAPVQPEAPVRAKLNPFNTTTNSTYRKNLSSHSPQLKSAYLSAPLYPEHIPFTCHIITL